ncbi:MAG: Esterase/lipase, partial [Myxococcaceae bacterium]|nr:Esterase/lipase [Myxococcaceae bacterium]
MSSTPIVNAVVERLEKIEHGAARALLKLVSRAPAPLLERFGRKLDGLHLHPELQLLLALNERIGHTGLAKASVELARARMRRDARVHTGVPIPVGAVHELTFPGAVGPLKARHYVPQGATSGKPRALLLFFHGGGFTV